MTAPYDRPVDWPRVRLHVVTGKGGTGKSTVAASLAMALASTGRNVLLCEVEGRQGIARMFDTDPLPYEERRIAKGAPDADGRAGQVHALHIDPESALLEYLAMYYKLGRAGKALDRFGVIDFATTIAPGVRDVLLTGKVYEAVQRPRGGRHRDQITYDAVVLDAPPTGRICQFLGVNSELAGLAKVGPIKSQADKVMELLRSDRTAVHLVTILEEMPVQETHDGIAELRAAGLPVGGIVVNLVRPQDLSASALAQVRKDRVDPTAVASDLARAKVDVDADLVTSLVDEARDHAVRRQLEDEQRALVAEEEVPTYELPRLAAGIDRGALLELAQLLRKQGMA
ncbi:anion-transporting ArsA/GET3 family ATPase [Nocardioides sp. BE266]|uniref:ArsA-related P-loop ATPase n=1 Tax=Nocardioides sp. BE266 TaxID=2817725 RepID=UPI00285444E7|nr:ArsA-related P-loop ATPase [Nocardioides sp. BE266]MDR7254642.1 anion-transporting ArsA/GET3 family ATPase [Nocardioides sp. BE266]